MDGAMSSFGRAQDGVIGVLEAFGIDPEQTAANWYERDENGEKRLVPLDEALAEVVYRIAFGMGEEVAIGRIVAAICEIGRGTE
jgi:hypothetical protein